MPRVLLALGLAAWCASLVQPAARAAEESDAPLQRVWLSANKPKSAGNESVGGLLVRELVRQAVLIAARDELGLSTHDAALREVQGNHDAHTLKLDINTKGAKAKSLLVRLSVDSELLKLPIFEQELPLANAEGDVVDYESLTVAAEALSREGLVEALKKAGVDGQPNMSAKSTDLPPAIDNELSQMNFLSQFAALRELHALNRAGESSQTLSGLVRAYSHLGVLTKFHWNAAHKTFKARALLYAERLIQRDGASSRTLWHRAYAQTLAGLHKSALANLEEAVQKASQTDPPQTPPAWAPLLEASCRYQTQVLRAVSDPKLLQLARLLAFLSVENSGCDSLFVPLGQRVTEIAPDCFLVWDSMNWLSSQANLTAATESGPVALRGVLPERLRKIRDVPQSVLSALPKPDQELDLEADPALADGTARAALVRALVNAEVSAGEPSWEVLGRLLEDVTLVQAFRRLSFLAGAMNLAPQPHERALQAARDMLPDHPYRAALEVAVLNRDRDADKIRQFCAQIRIFDASIAMAPFSWLAWPKQRGTQLSFGEKAWRQYHYHLDDVAGELEEYGRRSSDKQSAHRLHAVSPHAPRAIELFLTQDASYSAGRLPDWERQFSDHACVFRGLAYYYYQKQMFADAARCYEKQIALAPDQEAFGLLASVYYHHLDNRNKWRETLERSLDAPNYGDYHAQRRTMLAREELNAKNYDGALKYLEPAAEAGVPWVMVEVARIHEEMGDMAQAEHWLRDNAQRNPDQAFEWYFWCRRTGAGDVAEAEKLAHKLAETKPLVENNIEYDNRGAFYLLVDQKEKALAAFGKALEMSGNPYSALHVALTADELKKVDVRDAALVAAQERGPQYQSPGGVQTATVELARWMQEAYQDPANLIPDLDALAGIIEDAKAGDRANLPYFLGRFFLDQGNAELGNQYLIQCTELAHRGKLTLILAKSILRNR